MAKFWNSILYGFPQVIPLDQYPDLYPKTSLDGSNVLPCDFNYLVQNSFKVDQSTMKCNGRYFEIVNMDTLKSLPLISIQKTRSYQATGQSYILIGYWKKWIKQVENDLDYLYESLLIPISKPLVETEQVEIPSDYEFETRNEINGESDATVAIESAHSYTEIQDENYIHPKRLKKILRKQRQKQNKLLGKLY